MDISLIINLLLIKYFIPWTIAITSLNMVLLFAFFKKKVSLIKIGLSSTIISLIITYSSFIYRSMYYHVKIYGIFQPLSTIIIVILSSFLISNSLQRYSLTYSKIELRLLLFYTMVFISWYAIYLQAITTIGLENPEKLSVVHFYGLVVLISAEIASLAIYLVADLTFFPTYKYSSFFKISMYSVIGFSFGAALYNFDNDVVIVPERVHQYVFVFPNPLKIYTLISLVIIFFPYILMAYHARRAQKILLEAKKSGRGSIDPIAIPRLKLTEISMYVYLVGSSAGLLFTWAPLIFPEFRFPFGMNFALTVPFIGTLIIFLYITFQTPLRLKQYWRKKR